MGRGGGLTEWEGEMGGWYRCRVQRVVGQIHIRESVRDSCWNVICISYTTYVSHLRVVSTNICPVPTKQSQTRARRNGGMAEMAEMAETPRRNNHAQPTW